MRTIRTFPLVTPSARIGPIPPYDADPNAALQLVRPDIRRDGEGRPHLRRGCARSGHRIALAPAWSNEIGVRFARLTWSLKTSRREWCPLTSNLRWDRCCGIHIDLRHRQALFLLIGPACKVPSGL